MKSNIYVFLILLIFQSKVFGMATDEDFSRRLKNIDFEKKKFLIQISEREDACLNKFFSGECLEKLDIDYEMGIRDFELKAQEILRKKREFSAENRKKRRKRKE